MTVQLSFSKCRLLLLVRPSSTYHKRCSEVRSSPGQASLPKDSK